MPPGVTAVRPHRRHGCSGAVVLGKRVGLGVVWSGEASGVLGLDGGAAGGEKSLAGALGSPLLCPSAADKQGPPGSRARGREP
jgi:hypothetical protein